MSKAKSRAATIGLEQVRAFWHAKQGLSQPQPLPVASMVERTGWLRTLGGIEVYLAARARCQEMTRADLDTAVADDTLRVVPAVRGCIYLVPESDVPLVMGLAADLSRPRTERDLDRVGVSWNEVETLADAVVDALAGGPLSTNAIRKALPAGAVRSLGAVGKKVGLSSPLPVALRELEFAGRIERTLVGGRLDTERYEWRVPRRQPRARAANPAPGDQAGRTAAIAQRFLDFFGPVTTKELSTWVGISQRDANKALAALAVVPVAIEDHADEAWVLESELDALVDVAPPGVRVSLLPCMDNAVNVHGGPRPLVDPAHHDHPVAAWGKAQPQTLGQARHLAERALLAGDRMIGAWEYDPAADEIVTATFAAVPQGHKRALRDECARVAAFVRDQLGHARAFSIDTDDAVQKRAAAIRAMG